MKIAEKITKIADDIVEQATEYAPEDRYEVLEELIECWVEDEELSRHETRMLWDMVSARC